MEQVSLKDNIDDDEIDVRQIILTLLRYKWLILLVPLLLAVAGFAFSKLVLPKQYQATALVILTKPIFTTNLDTRIQTSPQLPDVKSVTDLVTADDLLLEITQSVDADGILGKGTTPEELKKNLSVTLNGSSELRLDVVGKNPQHVAQLANLWANKVVVRLNNLFDVNEGSLAQIAQQRDTALQKWSESQQALLNYLPGDRSSSLQVNLEQAKKNLGAYVQKIQGIDLLVSDITQFDSRLATQDQNAPLALNDALSLIALQQRSVEGENILQVQAVGPNILGDNYTVANARMVLKGLVDSITTQRTGLDTDRKNMEEQIASLATELEKEKYLLTQLTAKRDFDFNTYQALSNHEEEMRISLVQNDQVARLASQALPPQDDIGPHSAVNAIAAGFLGLVLVVVGIFAKEWWRSSDTSVPNVPADHRETVLVK